MNIFNFGASHQRPPGGQRPHQFYSGMRITGLEFKRCWCAGCRDIKSNYIDPYFVQVQISYILYYHQYANLVTV